MSMDELSVSLNQLKTDLLSDSWVIRTWSQAASDYLNDAHALDNHDELLEWFQENGLKPEEKLTKADFRMTAIASIHLIPDPIFTGVRLLTADDIAQLDKIPAPDFIICVENDNVLTTLGQKLTVPIISGNGNGINGERHRAFFNWCNRKHIPVYYLGDLDPIGIRFAQDAVNLIQNNDPLALYDQPGRFRLNLSQMGRISHVAKRMQLADVTDPLLLRYNSVFKDFGCTSYIEQEQLIDSYIKKIQALQNKA